MSSPVHADPGSVVVWGDIACPWASLAVHRLHTARDRLGLTEQVRFDHRAFALELVNERCTPKPTLDAEMAALGAHEPGLGWRRWRRADHEYPGSVLLALSAVQAAKDPDVGGLPASEELDLALRRAFYVDSRPIALWTEVMGVARRCTALDAERLEVRLRAGAGLGAVLEQAEQARAEAVQGSPHLFLPDGTDVHNPGLRFHWTQDDGRGFVAIDDDDPAVYDDILRRVAA